MQPAIGSAVPEGLPLCPVHPERPSVATCERCGRFLCEGCAVSRQPARCGECEARLADPLGVISQSFSIGGSLSQGWVLFRHAFPGLAAVSFLFGIFGGLLSYVVDQNTDSLADSLRWTRLFEGSVGLIAVGANLALLVGVAEGRPLGIGGALREGLSAWPRLFGAHFRAGLWVLLLCLLLVVPGLIKAVTLALVAEAAYREPDRDALDNSTQLVTGRRWEVFGLLVVSNLLIVVVVFPTAGLVGFLSVQAPASALVGEILLDGLGRVAEAFGYAVGLAAFYGFKRLHGQELSPR